MKIERGPVSGSVSVLSMSLGSWYEDMSYVTRFMLWQEPCFLTELDIAREKGERRELRKKISLSRIGNYGK